MPFVIRGPPTEKMFLYKLYLFFLFTGNARGGVKAHGQGYFFSSAGLQA